MADFDPYHKWFGISPKHQPPNHYRLLGLEKFETDLDVIAISADQRMTHVRSYQMGDHVAISQRILNEIATAKLTLLDPNKKAAYDLDLELETSSLPPLSKTPPLSGAPPLPGSPPPPLSGAPPLGNSVAPQEAEQEEVSFDFGPSESSDQGVPLVSVASRSKRGFQLNPVLHIVVPLVVLATGTVAYIIATSGPAASQSEASRDIENTFLTQTPADTEDEIEASTPDDVGNVGEFNEAGVIREDINKDDEREFEADYTESSNFDSRRREPKAKVKKESTKQIRSKYIAALRQGDVQVAMLAASQLAIREKRDPVNAQSKSLIKLADSSKTREDHSLIAQLSLNIANQAEQQGKRDVAKRSAALALLAARRSGYEDLINQVTLMLITMED